MRLFLSYDPMDVGNLRCLIFWEEDYYLIILRNHVYTNLRSLKTIVVMFSNIIVTRCYLGELGMKILRYH